MGGAQEQAMSLAEVVEEDLMLRAQGDAGGCSSRPIGRPWRAEQCHEATDWNFDRLAWTWRVIVRAASRRSPLHIR